MYSLVLAAAVALPHWALAAVPVVNNTNGASSVMSVSATLNGRLTSTGGLPTDIFAYWGTVDGGTNTGNWSNTGSVGTTNAVGPLSVTVSNLTPNRKYYYRFRAVNADGTAWASSTTNFQTLATSGPAPVVLGEAAHFTILAGAAVTTTGGGVIKGDVGAYPIAGSAIGIPPPQVDGIIYARDATGTQAPNVVIDADLLLRAKNDMHTAWVDAAGRTPVPSGDRLNPQGGNLGGLTLVPGLYKITTVAYITGSDLTLVGGPDDVWIFMCDQNLEVGSGIQVILAGGALAKNIFWQVGTSATIGTGASFKGTIIADQSITMLSTSTMEGRALAFGGGVTFNGTGGELPVSGKAINPTPADGATNQLITVTTSWENGGGATSYDVYFGTNAIPGIAEFKTNQTTLAYAPGALISSNTYYWRIDSQNAGGTMTGDVWSFTTASQALAGTVQFSKSTNSVLENGTSLTVTVTRLSGSLGAASVNYATSNGTAIAGADYTATSGTLNWTSGEISAKTFTIPILDNVIYEGNKIFTVALSGAVNVTPGIPALQTVTILENDAPAELIAPVIRITVPATNATYTSLTNLLNFGGTADDNIGVTHVTLRNSRDVAEYTVTLITTNWTFNGLPLFQGTNDVTATAYDASGNSAAATIRVFYAGDSDYDNVLRSGNIVQEIIFPDNLIPGETVTVQWKVLSYVPIVSRIYGGIPGGWYFYKNAVYTGMSVSTWNLNGRPANLYAFECAWVVPQKSGDFSAWFNVAQMDADQFMIPVIPDGVDSRPDPVYPKLIRRTVLAGGTGANPISDPDTWDEANIIETVDQHKERSAVTITAMSMPDNLTQGSLVTCEWKVQSYIDVDAQVLMLNLATSNLWVTTSATRIGTPVNTTFYFTDRVSGKRFYAKEYTFRASFLVPLQAGDQQLYFRSRARGDSLSAWMAQNLAADVDPRPVQENGMYGRLIERTINP